MEKGGDRENYYRIGISGKEEFTEAGNPSMDRALTHINIKSSSEEDIIRILEKIKNEISPRNNPKW